MIQTNFHELSLNFCIKETIIQKLNQIKQLIKLKNFQPLHKVRNITSELHEFFQNFSTIFEQEIKSGKSSYKTKFK